MSWSIERAIVGFLSGAAVAVQGVLDALSPPHFQPAGDSHPIPGCPRPVECRTHGCAGDCSESIEAEEQVDLSAFVCRAPGPFDCMNCSVDDFTLIPCEYDKTAPAAGAGSGVSAAGGGSPPSPSAACIDPSPTGDEGAVADSGIPKSPATAHLAEEIRDAVGDHYDNGRAVDPHILWHEAGMPAAIDWTGVAAALLRYFTITPK